MNDIPENVTTEIAENIALESDACISCSKNFMLETFAKAKTCLQFQKFCQDIFLTSENVCRTEMINQLNLAKRKQRIRQTKYWKALFLLFGKLIFISLVSGEET